jgi:hypothetical protein
MVRAMEILKEYLENNFKGLFVHVGELGRGLR